jgi:hypothetical protein
MGTAENGALLTADTQATTPNPAPALMSQNQAARVKALKSEWQVRCHKSPPQQFGCNALHLAAKLARTRPYTSASWRLRSALVTFGCTSDQQKATSHGQRHWGCENHRKNTSPEERLVLPIKSCLSHANYPGPWQGLVTWRKEGHYAV